VVIVSPTAPMQDKYLEIKRKIVKYHRTMEEDTVGKLYDIAFNYWKRNKNRKKKKRLVIIIDDLGENSYMKWVKKGNVLNDLIVGARHFKVYLCFLFQKLTQATGAVRMNSDVIYCFKLENKKERKTFWEEFCGEMEYEKFLKMANVAWEQKFGYLKIDKVDPNEKKYFIKEKTYTSSEDLGFDK